MIKSELILKLRKKYSSLSLNDTEKILEYHHHLHIPIGVWHNIKNHTDKVCKIIEIQYGTECIEEDIERDK